MSIQWRNFDAQALYKPVGLNPAKQELDPIASAKANLAQAKEELLSIGRLDHLRSSWRFSGNIYTFGLELMWAGARLPFDVAAEALDVPLGPVRAAKDVADAAVLGVIASLQAARKSR